jgi:hypothetical protein
VNRPFYAFGVLIAFLALAMLAIGLSSRPSAKQPSAAGSGSGLPRRQPGVTLYVMVMPDEDDSETRFYLEEFLKNEPQEENREAGAVACGRAARAAGYSPGCEFAGAAGDVFEDPGLWRSSAHAEAIERAAGLACVTIEPAMPPRIDDFDRSNLATGYDAAYDRAMSQGADTWKHAAATVEIEESSEPDADPLMLVFESLVRSDLPQLERKSNQARVSGRRWDYEAQAIGLGAQNRLWQWLELARIDDEWLAAAEQTGLVERAKPSSQSGLTWAEYTAWISSKQWTVAGRDSQKRANVAFWGEPRGQLLQIAVAGLNRVAELLHELVAPWLNQAAERIARLAERPQAAARAK